MAFRGLKHTDKSRKGDYWEYYVSLKAWERGAEVFKNLGGTGKADIVIAHDNHIVRCDVKLMSKRYKDTYYPQPITQMKNSPGVFMVCVHPKTLNICWHPHTIPDGLENFWD